MLKGRNLIEPMDLSVEELDEIFDLAEEIIKKPSEYSNICAGNLLATLFFEPSTRTRISFEAAMLKLGGKVIDFQNPHQAQLRRVRV